MLATAGNSFAPQRFIEHTRQLNDLRGIAPITTPTKRVVRFLIEGNIQDRAKIEIEPEEAQKSPRNLSMSPNEFKIIPFTQLLSVWRFLADQPEARHSSTFLVDGNYRLGRAQVAQIIDEFPQLGWTFDVATKQDEATGLDLSKKRSRFRVEPRTWNPGEDQLAQRSTVHRATLESVMRK